MRILIVEDEPTLGPQLKATLEGAGYAVDLATDGEDGHFLGSTENYETRPQKTDHELIIGRSTKGSVLAPDIDLTNRQASEMGVSRLHLSINYDAEHSAVLVSDLGSANGSFINGQRMMPKEVRVLRHGDELRLGKLVLLASFRHPG